MHDFGINFSKDEPPIPTQLHRQGLRFKFSIDQTRANQANVCLQLLEGMGIIDGVEIHNAHKKLLLWIDKHIEKI